LLLPSHVEHSTRAESAAQQHGELYLAPELLRDCQAGGVLQLDGAAQAMLDALWKPALSAAALPMLVEAFQTTPAALKLTLSVYFFGFAFSQLACGPLSDAYGRRPVAL
ncbi:hypothetical protein SB758_33080, partial [Burkholderia sp. SIMBA_013]